MRDPQTGQFMPANTEAKAEVVPVITTDTEYRYGQVIISLKRDGQEGSNESDQIQVCTTLSLPTKDDWEHLLDETYQFGNRVLLFGNELHLHWGKYNASNKMRIKSQTFQAYRWHQAFTLAKAYAETQADKLIQAIEERAQALRDAEKLD